MPGGDAPARRRKAGVSSSARRVAIVFRGEADAGPSARLEPLITALAGLCLEAEPVPYADQRANQARTRLLAADGVLAWVDPVTDEGDRAVLDAILREAAASGVWVGSHPDVIALMGTKEVLYTTRGLGWGSDTHLYATPEEFRRQFPARLAADGIRVLKPTRGNGGRGVWKVTFGDGRGGSPAPGPQTTIRAQHARPRDSSFEDITLAVLMARCETAFAAYGGTGKLIDQAFARRIGHGIIRTYLVKDQIASFGRQYPAGMSPEDPQDNPMDPESSQAAAAIMGLPANMVRHDPGDPAFARLRTRLEQEWIPGMRALLGLDPEDLPVLWDADFLLGPQAADGTDTYLLCEINASCVTPSSEVAPVVATATLQAVTR